MNKSIYEISKAPILAAIAAAKAIMDIYVQDFERIEKEDGSPLTAADLESSKIIRQHLEKTNIPITGEEVLKEPYSVRKEWPKSWCIDPLDGTKEFIKKNGEFVINIALIENQNAVFGLIASPIKEEIMIGGPKLGAYHFNFSDALDSEKWAKLPELKTLNEPIHLISSRSHYSGDILSLVDFIEENYGKVMSKQMGSALKFFDLVKGTSDIYPRFAPTMEWDIAAGQAIYEAVGGEVLQRGSGLPLVYNKENLKNPYFVASKKIIAIDLSN
jgi:3'(2'), 5'-bisphosphate nucleotidase